MPPIISKIKDNLMASCYCHDTWDTLCRICVKLNLISEEHMLSINEIFQGHLTEEQTTIKFKQNIYKTVHFLYLHIYVNQFA